MQYYQVPICEETSTGSDVHFGKAMPCYIGRAFTQMPSTFGYRRHVHVLLNVLTFSTPLRLC